MALTLDEAHKFKGNAGSKVTGKSKASLASGGWVQQSRDDIRTRSFCVSALLLWNQLHARADFSLAVAESPWLSALQLREPNSGSNRSLGVTLTGPSRLAYGPRGHAGASRGLALTQPASPTVHCPASVLARGKFMAACSFEASPGSITDKGDTAREPETELYIM